MKNINCIVCDSMESKVKFQKAAKDGASFQLVQCRTCGLEYISPQPSFSEVSKYYSSEYFLQRSERGYDNYFSNTVKNEIERVFKLNLKDLKFFEYENSLYNSKQSLDIGCAAGYFVNFLKNRNWNSHGIDISKECVEFAQTNGLSVIEGDYLNQSYKTKFNLITMWASIEHLHEPQKFIAKIYDDLTKDGILYISTCRVGFSFSKVFGKKWRFYNFPEHLFFFSIKTLKSLLKTYGFKIETIHTYGSGFGKGGSFLRRGADFMAKHFRLGDMMIISARKIK